MNTEPTDSIAQMLAGFIQKQAQAQSVQVEAFSRLSGGAIQSNYGLTVVCQGGTLPGRHELVVRSDSPSGVSASLSREEEFHVLQMAHRAGVTVPKPYWFCADTSLIGVPFCIMARVAGTASGRTLVRSTLTAEQARALTRQLGHELATIHSIHPPDARLPFLTVPNQDPSQARIQGYRRALGQIDEPHPALEYALLWLRRKAPPAAGVVLCHCDFRTGNYMVHEGRITGILDWEFATWSDPYEDLGWLCARSWRFGQFNLEVGGVGHKTDLFQAYTESTGRQVDPLTVEYWEVMAMVRWAIIALQQAQRHLSRQQPSLELALTGRMLPEIEMDILNQIEALESTP
ncbi:phosphotransferase family protein [Candidimonas sp. SYP-B2681]|uniref:phosphotransferase family protein n=1 Tax=Candidimonas sp. SYP-B2681 TaxID=2497686 RepID=UPI000F85EA4D|nr:phosphotransferase family protein [Candidimonas sp. SYP-B2681]RTZ44626.1 phosphotransferase family protein [Candidimonas sp. SYP-B2681]